MHTKTCMQQIISKQHLFLIKNGLQTVLAASYVGIDNRDFEQIQMNPICGKSILQDRRRLQERILLKGTYLLSYCLFSCLAAVDNFLFPSSVSLFPLISFSLKSPLPLKSISFVSCIITIRSGQSTLVSASRPFPSSHGHFIPHSIPATF